LGCGKDNKITIHILKIEWGFVMNTNGHFDKLVNLASQDTEKAASLVAKSFYKILKKNGFTNDQIISVANNLLGCFIQALDGYKEKSQG
jgi:hypothetical protein